MVYISRKFKDQKQEEDEIIDFADDDLEGQKKIFRRSGNISYCTLWISGNRAYDLGGNDSISVDGNNESGDWRNWEGWGELKKMISPKEIAKHTI